MFGPEDPTVQQWKTCESRYGSLYLPTRPSSMETRKTKSSRTSEKKDTPRRQQNLFFEMTGSIYPNIDVVAVPVNDFSGLKHKLNSTKRVRDQLCDWIKLRKEKSVGLEEGLISTRVVSECAMTSKSSHPSRCSSELRCYGVFDELYTVKVALAWKLFSMDIPSSLCSHLSNLYDQMMFLNTFIPPKPVPPSQRLIICKPHLGSLSRT